MSSGETPKKKTKPIRTLPTPKRRGNNPVAHPNPKSPAGKPE
jgi:hypothetical protein